MTTLLLTSLITSYDFLAAFTITWHLIGTSETTFNFLSGGCRSRCNFDRQLDEILNVKG